MFWWVIILIVVVLLAALWFYSDSPPSVPVKGSHVIITGGSSGIGLATAKKLASEGAHVTIIARNEEKLKKAKKEIESCCQSGSAQRILQYSADVTDFDSLQGAIDDSALMNNERIDVLIACAGDTSPLRFEDIPLHMFQRVNDINTIGVIYSCRAVLPYMRRNESGRVIFVSSLVGLMGFPGYSGYCASKFAIRGLAESLSVEYNRWNIYFSLNIPQNVNTPMFEEEEKSKPEEVKVLEEGSEVVSAESVADSIINSLTNYSFFITHGFEPTFTSFGNGGFAPGSFKEVAAQFFLGPILRITALFYINMWRSILRKYKNVHN